MKRTYFIAVMLAGAGFLAVGGCDSSSPRRGRTLSSMGADSGVYLRSIAGTLNDLPGSADLNLLPAQPILTASSSADGKEVRAICTTSPQVPDGPINYLRCVDGNGKFYSVDVRPGDIVRYYIVAGEESEALQVDRRTALELRVRRLDTTDPESGLIIEGDLRPSGGSPEEIRAQIEALATLPQRIEIWRYSDKRMDAIRSALDRYEKLRRPAMGWEPTPDLGALRQVVERSNQWLRNQPTAEKSWRPTKLVDGLPSEVRLAKGAAEAISLENLRDGTFADWEGRSLEEAIWLRDISQWARGKAGSDREVAAALFDWTVRNVALDGAGAPATVYHPWEALAYGHGSAAMRAWVFAGLCRQQRIDVVLLRPVVEGDPEKAPLLAAAIADGELYLFDPLLGVAIPTGKEGAKGTPATFRELAANPGIVRQLDVEGLFEYPLDAESADEWEAFVIASPLELTRRAELLEGAIEGEDYVRLTADVDETAKKLAGVPEIKSIKLWPQPFQSLADEQAIKISVRREAVAEFEPFADRPVLWKARMLHFQGEKGIRADQRNDPLAQPRRGHADALRLYQDPTVRIGDVTLAKLEEAKRVVYEAAKADASYWLGLLSYDRGNYDVAADWLGERTLAALPEGKWAEGARYNLARTYEKLSASPNVEDAARQKYRDQAISLLEETPADSPYRAGNLVLASRLKAAPSTEDEQASQADAQ